MKALEFSSLVLLSMALASSSQAFSYATGACATSQCAEGEQWLYTNANEIDTALDSIESTNTTQTSDIATLNTALAGYLPLAGGVMDSGSTIDLIGAFISAGNGSVIGPNGTGSIIATSMSSTKQIDNNDLADGAVDLDGVEVEGTLPTTKGGTGATALTNLITLATHTTGNFVATVADSGASEITVANSGSENAAVTLAIASTITRDTELATISAASSTVGCVPKFSDTVGDVVDTGVCVDSSNNVTTPGAASFGGSTGASTFIMRNMADGVWYECGFSGSGIQCGVDDNGDPDGTIGLTTTGLTTWTVRNTVDSGWVECGVVGTTMTCATDADGTPDGTL